MRSIGVLVTGRGYWADVHRKTISSVGSWDFGSGEVSFRLLSESASSPDIAVLSSSPERNVTQLRKLPRNVGVIIEKPITIPSSPDLSHFDGDWQRPLFLVGHQHLFSESYRRLTELCLSTSVQKIIVRSGGRGPFRHYPALYDYGPHDFSMLFNLLDKNDDAPEIIERVSGTENEYSLDLKTFRGTEVHVETSIYRERRVREFSVFTNHGHYLYTQTDAGMVLYFNSKLIGTDVSLPLHHQFLSAVSTYINGGGGCGIFGSDFIRRVYGYIGMLGRLLNA